MRVAVVVVGTVLAALGAISLASDVAGWSGLSELGQQVASGPIARAEGLVGTAVQVLNELVVDLPGWLVILGIVALTLGGVAAAAALARPRPAAVGAAPSARPARRPSRGAAASAPAAPVASAVSSAPVASAVSSAPVASAAPAAPVSTAGASPAPAAPVSTTPAGTARGSGVTVVPPAPGAADARAPGPGRDGRAGGAAAARLAPWLIATRHRLRVWWGTRRHRPLRAARVAARHLGAVLLRTLRVALRRARVLARSTLSDVRALGRGGGGAEPAAAPDWRTVARDVHAEVGGEWTMLRHLAERMVAARMQARRQLRVATLPGTVVAWALAAVPLVAVVGRAALDPAYRERLTSVPSLRVAAAVLLVIAGAWWLARLARPPFSARPAVRQSYAHERAQAAALEAALERSALYAAADVPLEDALRRAGGAAPVGPARQLARWVGGHRSDVLTVPDSGTALGRCTQALDRWLADGAPPEEALAASAARLRHEHELAVGRGLRSTLRALLAPLLVCVVPALLLLVAL